jgi:hypothetical protein
MASTKAIVAVDTELQWVFAAPGVPQGAARTASAEALLELTMSLDGELAEAAAAAGLVADPGSPAGAAETAVLRRLAASASAADERGDRGLPALPFIGEPFGGDGGTD